MARLSAALAAVAAASAVSLMLPAEASSQTATQTATLRPGPGAAVTSMDLSAGIPVLQVEVNGRGPLRIGLDTGATGGVYLFGGGATRIGLAPTGELDASDPSGGAPQRLSDYGAVVIALGGRVFASTLAGSAAPAPGRLQGLDGILGLEVFGPALITLDFPNRRLTIDPPGLPAPDGRTIFAYEGSLPMLPLDVEDQHLRAYLDTGDVRAGLVLPASLADRLAGRASARPAGVARTINAERPMFAVALSGRARVGATLLPVAEAQFPSVAPIGIVGAEPLQGLVVRIDTLNRRIQLLTPSPVAAAGLPPNRLAAGSR